MGIHRQPSIYLLLVYMLAYACTCAECSAGPSENEYCVALDLGIDRTTIPCCSVHL